MTKMNSGKTQKVNFAFQPKFKKIMQLKKLGKLHYGSVWIELILLKLKTENTVAK